MALPAIGAFPERISERELFQEAWQRMHTRLDALYTTYSNQITPRPEQTMEFNRIVGSVLGSQIEIVARDAGLHDVFLRNLPPTPDLIPFSRPPVDRMFTHTEARGLLNAVQVHLDDVRVEVLLN